MCNRKFVFRRPCEGQAETAADEPASTLGTAANAPSPNEDIYVAVEFSLALPPGFREAAVLPPKPAETRPGFGSFGTRPPCAAADTLHPMTLCGP